MRVLLTTYVHVWALGAEMQVCAPPNQECTELQAGVGVALVPIGQPVTKAMPPADLPLRAAEKWDAPIATGVMPIGGCR